MLDLSGLTAAVLQNMPQAHPFAWKTGTKGWYASDKVQVGDKRYQVQANLYAINSKDASIPTSAADMGAVLGAVHFMPHQWKTGTRGALATGKTVIDGARVQVQVNAFEVGSKDANAAKVEQVVKQMVPVNTGKRASAKRSRK